jgi:hypothetical protein
MQTLIEKRRREQLEALRRRMGLERRRRVQECVRRWQWHLTGDASEAA